MFKIIALVFCVVLVIVGSLLMKNSENMAKLLLPENIPAKQKQIKTLSVGYIILGFIALLFVFYPDQLAVISYVIFSMIYSMIASLFLIKRN